MNHPDPQAHRELKSLLLRIVNLDASGASIPEALAKDFLNTAILTNLLQIRSEGYSGMEATEELGRRVSGEMASVREVSRIWDEEEG
ncbi:MAG: hypothetical protein J0L75_11995 [Spirochaetes bacterium]|nr:hypothetical protein [Spirochaetota bacterium]